MYPFIFVILLLSQSHFKAHLSAPNVPPLTSVLLDLTHSFSKVNNSRSTIISEDATSVERISLGDFYLSSLELVGTKVWRYGGLDAERSPRPRFH